MVNAGATWLDQEVVRDGNLVTSREPHDLVPFVRAIKAIFSESAPIPTSRSEQRESAPQRNQPPQLMLSAMKWMPRPSFRTAIGLGALAMAGFAIKSNLATRRTVEGSPHEQATAVGS